MGTVEKLLLEALAEIRQETDRLCDVCRHPRSWHRDAHSASDYAGGLPRCRGCQTLHSFAQIDTAEFSKDGE